MFNDFADFKSFIKAMFLFAFVIFPLWAAIVTLAVLTFSTIGWGIFHLFKLIIGA